MVFIVSSFIASGDEFLSRCNAKRLCSEPLFFCTRHFSRVPAEGLLLPELHMKGRRFSPVQGLFLLTFAVRVFVAMQLCSMPFFIPNGGDMKFYSDWGLRVAHGNFTDHQAFYGLPGYPFLLGLLFRLLNFDNFWVSVIAGMIQALADALTSVFIWKLAGEAFPAKSEEGASPAQVIGGLAGIGWALYQPAQAFSAVLMPTALAVAAYWYCVWELSRRRERFSVWAPWLPLGVLIGIAAMMVATILFLVPMGLVAIVLRYRENRGENAGRTSTLRPVAAAALLIAGLYAGAAPCWIHNYFIAHEPVMLSAHSGLNFYIGNNPLATGYPKIPPGMNAGQEGMLKDSITLAENAEGHPLKHYQVSQYWSAKAHDYIANHRAEWLRLMGKKFVNFWNSFQYDDLSLITLFSNAGLLAPGPRFGWVAALAIPGLLLALWKQRRAGWIVAAVLLHMGALMPVFVTERYRLAAVPGLLLLGAYGLWEFWSYLSRARWAPALGYACAGAAVAFWVGTPPADASLWSLDYYNTGIKAMDQGDYPLARHDLETAYRYVPDNSEVNFALGLLWQQQGDVRRAETFYGIALAINPRHAGAWNNIGVLASKQKVWAVAVRCFSKALAIDASDAKAQYLRAHAYAEMGQWSNAQGSIDRALSLDPGQKEFVQLNAQIASHGPVTGE
jgi:tetratricopeptide (TPR) repeat protein